MVRRSEIPASVIRWTKLAQEHESVDEFIAEAEIAVVILLIATFKLRLLDQGQ